MKPATHPTTCPASIHLKPYWTQSRLASRFRVSRAHMSLVLAGKRESQALLRAVAAFVGPERFRELAAAPAPPPSPAATPETGLAPEPIPEPPQPGPPTP